MASAGNMVTQEEWAAARAQALQYMPEVMEELAEVDILLRYQQQVIYELSHYNLVVDEKSRRIGVTWGTGSAAVLTAGAKKAAGGMDALYIGYNLDMAREFIDVCAMWARAFNMVAGEVDEFIFSDRSKDGDKDIQAFRIRFASGFEIVALSSRPRSLRGRQGLVIIDEAAFHDDLDELIKAAMALLIWGGKVLIISTHDGDDNPFNILIQDIRAGRRPGKVIKTDFDQALKDGLYQRICLVTGKEWSPELEAAWRQEVIDYYGDDADEELFVIPSKGGGRFLPLALVESRTEQGIPVFRLERPNEFTFAPEHVRIADIREWCEDNLRPVLDRLDPGIEHFFGQDFARSGHLSVFWAAQKQRNLVRRCPFVVEMRNLPFEQQKQLLFYMVRRLPRFVAGALDSTGNGQWLGEVAAQEFGEQRIIQAHFSRSFYEEFMPKFKAGFEDGLVLLPADKEIVDDHRAIQRVRGVPMVPRENQTKKGQKRHGDGAIAHFLSYVATLQDVYPVEFFADQEPAGTDPFRTGPAAETIHDIMETGLDWSGYE